MGLDEVMEELETHLLVGQELKTIYTPNTEIVMDCKKNEQLLNIINSGDWVTPDGIGLIYAAKMKGKSLTERVTGVDISTRLLGLGHAYGLRFFFLGGKPGIAEKASLEVKKNYPGIKEIGFHHGYFKGIPQNKPGDKEELTVISMINEFSPDIIFVGLGSPKQELFINSYKNKLNAKLIIGNGGVLNILSGEAKRAPDFFIRHNLEWFYRLLQEPSRIIRQLALPKFLINVMIDKKAVIEEE